MVDFDLLDARLVLHLSYTVRKHKSRYLETIQISRKLGRLINLISEFIDHPLN